jgi:large subunit ribosomal protein L9
LIPYGFALPANEANEAAFVAKREAFLAASVEKLAQAGQRKLAIEVLSAEIKCKTADEGRLYGSIGTREIADAVTALGVVLEKSEVRLPNGAIRHVGDYEIQVYLHSEVEAILKLRILAE